MRGDIQPPPVGHLPHEVPPLVLVENHGAEFLRGRRLGSSTSQLQGELAVDPSEASHGLDRGGTHDGLLDLSPLGAMESLIPGVPVADQTLRERLADKSLGDERWIVAQSGEQLAKDLRGLRLGGHAVHLGLQLGSGDRAVPDLRQGVRLPEIIIDLRTEDRLRHHVAQRRFGQIVGLGPDPVGPVDLLDRPLGGQAILECDLSRLEGSQKDREHRRDEYEEHHCPLSARSRTFHAFFSLRNGPGAERPGKQTPPITNSYGQPPPASIVLSWDPRPRPSSMPQSECDWKSRRSGDQMAALLTPPPITT